MAKDRFLIAPFESGLQKNLTPFLIPEDAFQRMDNAYIKDGVVKKRSSLAYTGIGGDSEYLKQLNSRLKIYVNKTDSNGNASGLLTTVTFKPGQIFACGEEIFTITETGTSVVMLTTGSSTTHTINTSTGAYNIVGSEKNTDIFFYLSEPVMGLTLIEDSSKNNRETLAFDTRFSYRYSSGGYWIGLDNATTQWNGDDSNYFYSTQYRGALSNKTYLITSNYKYTTGSPGSYDPIRYYNPNASVGTYWTDYEPYTVIVPPPEEEEEPVEYYTVVTAKIIIPFANSLLFFGTVEKHTTATGTTITEHRNRVRWSGIGNALDPETSFLEPNQTSWVGGGYSDANTQEDIVSVKQLKDRLIVYFERSTYILLYTRNPVDPYRWEKIDTQYGSDKTYSSISFDNNVIAIGQQGIINSNGNNVSRIDKKIPYFTSEVTNEDSLDDKVHGIRDMFENIIYWNYIPASDRDFVNYPNKYLVYNYINNTWSKFDESTTVFGYLEQTISNTWRYDFQTWREDSSTWRDGLKEKSARRVICGNHKGFIHFIYPNNNFNDGGLYVTKLENVGQVLKITSEDHNLKTDDFIYIGGCQGVDFTQGIYKIYNAYDKDTLYIVLRQRNDGLYFSGTYNGGGYISLASKLKIKSKDWNPYIKKGVGVSLSEINFYITKQDRSQVTIDYFIDSSSKSMNEEEQLLGLNLGDNALDLGAIDLKPMEQYTDKVWHNMYFRGSGNFVNIYITLTDSQMINYCKSGFELHGMVLYTEPNI